MRAVVMNAAGGPDVLTPADIPAPVLTGPYSVLVKLHAAGVNPIDTKVRKANMYYPDKLPSILGCDGAGVVERVGSSVTRVRPGDEVYFFNNGLGGPAGAYAEYSVVQEDYLAFKPKNLSMLEAAALPVPVLTAWEALVNRGHLGEGESTLIHAGAGGVGHIAIQLAHYLNAPVATTISSPEKARFAQALGAERTIDYTREDFVEAATNWTHGEGVRLVMDTVGSQTFCKSFGATRLYGRMVTLLSTTCEMAHTNTARLRNLSIGYVQVAAPLYFGLHSARLVQTRILEHCAILFEQGALKVHISEVLPLEQAADAHRIIEAGHAMGKIVLQIS
ncbi:MULTISPECIES: zinc-dependent alcohol dehydrogenase family protein [unclassified Nitrosospira]|uniref:zinc-dependent alcohol dehydrogenase family protein n=1 Tax=unclassified Nitrosospira TaxID=2609267 RepID=UPI000D323C10|nr:MULTISPECIES: zinc-dependent alcohol dehydrogenase family protein [unclassified Nitrosospira]WON74488.1 zinc-dependent alcohol dehydrogenase family protein [Nitrosospira sp. Is2]